MSPGQTGAPGASGAEGLRYSPAGLGGGRWGPRPPRPAEPVLPEAARSLSSLELGKFRRETKCAPSWACLENQRRRDESLCQTAPGLNLGLAASSGKVSVHGAAVSWRTDRAGQGDKAAPRKGGLVWVPEPKRATRSSARGQRAVRTPQSVEGGQARGAGVGQVRGPFKC